MPEWVLVVTCCHYEKHSRTEMTQGWQYSIPSLTPMLGLLSRVVEENLILALMPTPLKSHMTPQVGGWFPSSYNIWFPPTQKWGRWILSGQDLAACAHPSKGHPSPGWCSHRLTGKWTRQVGINTLQWSLRSEQCQGRDNWYSVMGKVELCSPILISGVFKGPWASPRDEGTVEGTRFLKKRKNGFLLPFPSFLPFLALWKYN